MKSERKTKILAAVRKKITRSVSPVIVKKPNTDAPCFLNEVEKHTFRIIKMRDISASRAWADGLCAMIVRNRLGVYPIDYYCWESVNSSRVRRKDMRDYVCIGNHSREALFPKAFPVSMILDDSWRSRVSNATLRNLYFASDIVLYDEKNERVLFYKYRKTMKAMGMSAAKYASYKPYYV